MRPDRREAKLRGSRRAQVARIGEWNSLNIESRRDRLITILVIPLMTCSARLPVYAMVAAMAGTLLYPGDGNAWERGMLGGALFFGWMLLSSFGDAADGIDLD